MEEDQKLLFAVNGERYELYSVDPSITLLEFLRSETQYKGVKLGCGEGGCGACVVLLSKYDPINDQIEEFTVSSCLTLLCSIHGCSITTTEGLGNSKDGFHPIHQRFSGFHASQCGFCTPGFCMSLFSALVNAEKTQRPNPPAGFSKLKVSEGEKAISGNLCRCTGYRPIVDVCKSFASDVDMEDLGLNSFWRKGEKADINIDKFPFYSPNGVCTFPDFLINELKSPKQCFSNLYMKNSDNVRISKLGLTFNSNSVSIRSRERHWYSPITIEELQKLFKYKKTEEENRIKLIVGNTGAGIYKELDHYDTYIDISHIPELSVIRRDSSGIEIGAAVTISKSIKALRGEKGLVFTKIADHMSQVASEFVRNTASLGGNLIMAQRNPFPSDIATILLAAGSSVNIHTGSEIVMLTLEQFLERPPCNSKTLLLSIRIPSWDRLRNFSSEFNGSIDNNPINGTILLFETYRAAPRPLGNAVSYLNAGILAWVSTNRKSEDSVLESLQLAFGAYGTEHAIRARSVEEFLAGKPITVAVLLEAITMLRAIIIPKEGTLSPAYRSSLAVGFFFDFLRPFVKGLTDTEKHLQISDVVASAKTPNGGLNRSINGVADMFPENGNCYVQHDNLARLGPILSAKQVVEVSTEYYPVGEPIKKAGAELQASGEAVFVDDIPSPKDCLHGAFICSTRPLARVKGIEFKTSLASQRIVTLISAKDIPRGGENIGSQSIFGTEPLFADDLAQFAGQPLGFVIAETQRYANMVANLATVDYDTENLEPPILTVEEAVERSSFFEVPSFLSPKHVGDLSEGMAEADHKILSAEIKLGSQYYFYMETQTAMAIPDEDNCMVVYSSTQCPASAQRVIAKCLGIPDHNVRVITRRVGGGFGGKALRSLPKIVTTLFCIKPCSKAY
ncbi:putative aldehyde oxidase 4 [Tasmannia lanceolata]|uniref:putative aldehyde oxidase 4 n=1 Tax=Tasmannia lanceolata TaxID=3420 RepID=UPI004064C033